MINSGAGANMGGSGRYGGRKHDGTKTHPNPRDTFHLQPVPLELSPVHLQSILDTCIRDLDLLISVYRDRGVVGIAGASVVSFETGPAGTNRGGVETSTLR